jgi:hypothetical protein
MKFEKRLHEIVKSEFDFISKSIIIIIIIIIITIQNHNKT